MAFKTTVFPVNVLKTFSPLKAFGCSYQSKAPEGNSSFLKSALSKASFDCLSRISGKRLKGAFTLVFRAKK